MLKGFINVYKPIGMTSNDVVVKVRGILKAATGERQKVGHLGTLDPMAEGVLPIAVGTATRLFETALKKRKTYVATFVFGMETDTLDGAGTVINTCDCDISEDDIEAVLDKFRGVLLQEPPQYSAKSVNGQRAYDLARKGQTVELPPKEITVYGISVLEKVAKNAYRLKIECSSGTYIRALARDMARAMGTVGYMSALLRTASGQFDISDSVRIEDVQADPAGHIIPIERALGDMPALELAPDMRAKALNGVKICADMPPVSPFLVTVDGVAAAIGVNDNGRLKLTVRL